ncbi:tetratricopeptide repeat protein [Verrucomicrobia bacterium S94]|nr:tetratricopeptide repeat protein [Verrucomicrobia bacterium S94]
MKYPYFAALILGCSLSLQAGTQLSFETETKTRIDYEGHKTNIVHAGSLSVYLGADVIDMAAKNDIRIYDYKTRKIHTSSGNGFQQSSLYSDIGFRSAEFRNRLKIGDMLAAAGMQENPMDRVLMEHLFSMRSGKAAELKRQNRKTEIQISHNAKPLLSYSTNGISAQNQLKAPFFVFLRIRFGIHPDIIDELTTLDYIPEQLIINQYNTGQQEEISLKLTEVSTDARRPERDLQKNRISNPASVYVPAQKAMQMSRSDYDAACTSLLTRASEHAGEGEMLDAACLFLSAGLATGIQDMPAAFFDWKESIIADPDVTAMFSALSPRSEEEAEKALETLDRLYNKTADGKFTLLIFKANILESLGKPEEATECFIKALGQEPAIVGAWKDLGNIYYNMFNTQEAWTCWDTARALNPQHPFLKEIRELERSLEKQNPGFFPPSP